MSDYIPAALRRLVIERAGGRCEYCLLPSEDVLLPHEPDHITATKHGGATTAENLAFACFLCNRHKGTDLASIDPDTGRVERLSHPRQDRWEAHFRLEGGRILPLTPEGRATSLLLRFNYPASVKLRASLERAGRLPG